MLLARVIGTVQATAVCRSCEGLRGIKLLWVQPEHADGRVAGDAFVACDATPQAGPGDRVYIVDGREATMALPDDFVPADFTIVGIVDEVDVP